jgi:hypothetical protein
MIIKEHSRTKKTGIKMRKLRIKATLQQRRRPAKAQVALVESESMSKRQTGATHQG